MTHESLDSYYTNNFHVMFHRDIGFENHFRLSDLDEMLPWEREIYMLLMNQKIETYQKKS